MGSQSSQHTSTRRKQRVVFLNILEKCALSQLTQCAEHVSHMITTTTFLLTCNSPIFKEAEGTGGPISWSSVHFILVHQRGFFFLILKTGITMIIARNINGRYSSRSSLQQMTYSLYTGCFSENLPYFGKTFLYPQLNGYRDNAARSFKE